MPVMGDLDSKFSKTNIRFEISTFQIGNKQNFIKIRKLIQANKGTSKIPQDIEILGSCSAGPVLLHGEKVPL